MTGLDKSSLIIFSVEQWWISISPLFTWSVTKMLYVNSTAPLSGGCTALYFQENCAPVILHKDAFTNIITLLFLKNFGP